MGVDGAVPLEWRLFKPVEALQQTSNVVGLLLVNEPLGLGDVNLLSELGVEKCHVDVDLVDLKVACIREGK